MDPFEGEAFDFVSRFKCTVIGPRCLLTSLAEGTPVPELPYPMYTATLRGIDYKMQTLASCRTGLKLRFCEI